MWLPLLFTYVMLAAAKDHEVPCDTCVKMNAVCYNIIHIMNLQAPFRETVVISQLGILRSKNILFYAFEPNITDPEYYKIGYVNLDALDNQGILEGSKPVVNFKTFDIDQSKNTMYIGGGDAIYILEDNASKGVFFSSAGDTIQSIFFKKNLYFVRYGEFKLIELEGELFTPFKQFRNIKTFVIDRNNYLVFLNTSGLYVNKLHTNDTQQVSRNPFFRGLTMDLDGFVYAWYLDGIYGVKIESDIFDSSLEKIVDIPNIGALTFDNDNNLLFTSSRGLYTLVQTNTTLC